MLNNSSQQIRDCIQRDYRGRRSRKQNSKDHDYSVTGSFTSRRNGQALAYLYFDDEPGGRSSAKLLTRDEARRITRQYRELAEVTEES